MLRPRANDGRREDDRTCRRPNKVGTAGPLPCRLVGPAAFEFIAEKRVKPLVQHTVPRHLTALFTVSSEA